MVSTGRTKGCWTSEWETQQPACNCNKCSLLADAFFCRRFHHHDVAAAAAAEARWQMMRMCWVKLGACRAVPPVDRSHNTTVDAAAWGQPSRRGYRPTYCTLSSHRSLDASTTRYISFRASSTCRLASPLSVQPAYHQISDDTARHLTYVCHISLSFVSVTKLISITATWRRATVPDIFSIWQNFWTYHDRPHLVTSLC